MICILRSHFGDLADYILPVLQRHLILRGWVHSMLGATVLVIYLLCLSSLGR